MYVGTNWVGLSRPPVHQPALKSFKLHGAVSAIVASINFCISGTSYLDMIAKCLDSMLCQVSAATASTYVQALRKRKS